MQEFIFQPAMLSSFLIGGKFFFETINRFIYILDFINLIHTILPPSREVEGDAMFFHSFYIKIGRAKEIVSQIGNCQPSQCGPGSWLGAFITVKQLILMTILFIECD